MSNLVAGVARRIINPQLGIKRPGVRLFADPMQAIESDLTATALVLDDGEGRLVFVAVDLAAVGKLVMARLRQQIASALDTPSDHVLINESHTHAGVAMPEYIVEPPEQAARQAAYQEDFKRWVVEAAGGGGGKAAAGTHRRRLGGI